MSCSMSSLWNYFVISVIGTVGKIKNNSKSSDIALVFIRN